MPLTTDLSPAAFLEWERTCDIKHEYLDGKVFVLAGAKDSHVTVSGNLLAQLHGHLRGGLCRLYMADMKVSVEKVNGFFYPDIMVTCDERDRETEYYKRFPSLIVEVLSESTAAFDRGNKFSSYRKLDTLREYLLIDPDTMNVDCFRLDEATGHWVLYPFSSGDMMELASICFSTPIESLYENVATVSV